MFLCHQGLGAAFCVLTWGGLQRLVCIGQAISSCFVDFQGLRNFIYNDMQAKPDLSSTVSNIQLIQLVCCNVIKQIQVNEGCLFLGNYVTVCEYILFSCHYPKRTLYPVNRTKHPAPHQNSCWPLIAHSKPLHNWHCDSFILVQIK